MAQIKRSADALIIGGGIHGCSAALHLAQRGYSAIVLEKDHVGRHASGVNAGGVRRLGRAYAEVPLAQSAWRYWRDIRSLVDDDCGYRVSRYLKVARTQSDLDDARKRVGELSALGFSHEEVIDGSVLRELLPSASRACIGALHVEGDGSANPARTTQAFRRRAEVLGAKIYEGAPVDRIERSESIWSVTTAHGRFEAPVLVNAAGAWGGAVASRLGDSVPLQAHAPMLAITEPVAPVADAVVGVLNDTLSFKQMENGTVLLGGGVRGRAFPETNRTALDFAGIARFLRTAAEAIPAISGARVVRAWAGIEGYTPDALPVIGQGGPEGIVHVFGFSAHGFQLAPAVGGLVADLVTGTVPDLPLDAFRPGRFNSGNGVACLSG